MDVEGKLEGLQPYVIHSTRYYQVYYTHADAPDTILQCRLPFDAIDSSLKPGDLITITYLLRTVMAINPRR